MTAANISDAVGDPSVHFQTFTADSLAAFVSVWKTRQVEAADMHHDAELRDRAERILSFVAEVPAADLRLYVLPAQKAGFLYRVSTKETLPVTAPA